MKKYIISPSILSADFAKLGQEVSDVIKAGADWIHLDIMDNHYVPNLTIGPAVCASIKPYVGNALIDVHLMITPVDTMIAQFAKAGADIIVFHPEASLHVDRSIDLIKSFGLKAGIALNPATTTLCLDYILDKIDLVLVMSVNPGFGGQLFIPTVLKKIRELRNKIDSTGRDIVLQVDGGINLENLSNIANCGARAFVAGSSIFNSGNSYSEVIKSMRNVLSIV